MYNRIKEFRTKVGISQAQFSTYLGVSISSLKRWENNEAEPSPLAKKRIEEIMKLTEKELVEYCWRQNRKKESLASCNAEFLYEGKNFIAQWSPYVVNGPADQNGFYETLAKLQEDVKIDLPRDQYFSRLSLFQSVNGIETSQYLMEQPKPNAKSWSADYGTHNFHRYVGRFPPHLVRAIINSFGAISDDIILDPFCGSGTTLVEARMLGISAKGIEISPLSAMISRVKSQFPQNGIDFMQLNNELDFFYIAEWNAFLKERDLIEISYNEILSRKGNSIKNFANIERWFTKEALLGTSIVVEFILTKEGYIKDFLTIALSARMRSIGNVDVDVVRAEYRKTPRQNVDVLKLVKAQIRKMAKGIESTINSCKNTMVKSTQIDVIEGNVLTTTIKPSSISFIITSPPYGVESLSYLRTHLLSFRALEPILGVDPYNFGEGIIGSEYLDDKVPNVAQFFVKSISKTYNLFFKQVMLLAKNKKDEKRIIMMMKFFEDMAEVIKRFSIWLQENGKVAFIIGNKTVCDLMIPTEKIVTEIFEYYEFELVDTIAHKLKTNNSNSKVPWQDRIIENEFVLIFTKRGK